MGITSGWAAVIVGLLALLTGIAGTGLTLLVKSWWRMEDKIERTNTNIDTKIDTLRGENQAAHAEIRTNINNLKDVLINRKQEGSG